MKLLNARIKSSLAKEIDLSSEAGWAYLKALPLLRQKRRMMMSQPWVVHLFSGGGKGVDPILKEIEGDAVVEIDIETSKTFDMRRPAATYRALLWACARGMMKGIFGAPPCRNAEDEQLVAKQIWLSTVTEAARAMCYKSPVYIMVEGEKLIKNVKDEESSLLPGL